jgi:hypothetical protein
LLTIGTRPVSKRVAAAPTSTAAEKIKQSIEL